MKMLTLGVGPSAEMWKRYKPYLKQEVGGHLTVLRRTADNNRLRTLATRSLEE